MDWPDRRTIRVTTMSDNQSVRYCSCGTRLARDNLDTRCALCQQQARDLVLHPPEVPPGFWDTDQLRDAFASWHMGRVIRAYRHHPFHGRPLPQELVGGWFEITQAQLSRIEHGPPVRDLHKLIDWAQTLRIPAHLLWFDLPGKRRDSSSDQDQLEGILLDSDVMMVWLVETIHGRPVLVPVRLSRRKLLAAGGAGLLSALAGFLNPDELTRVEAAIVTPSRADSATVGHLEALLAHYRGLDHQVGPRRLLVPVQSTLDLVDDLHKAARPDVRQALLSLSAQYEQLTGWLLTDSGDHARAKRAYDRAIDRAGEAGDQPLVQYVLACKSEQARYEGHTDAALELAQAAQASGGKLTPAVRARAADFEARTWALKGERGGCERKLDESASLLAESAANGRADEPPWISYFVEEQLAVHRGICLADLGDAVPAIETFDLALAGLSRERIRDRAYYLACSAQAHAGNHDPEQAAVVAQQGARIAITTGSGRALAKLTAFYAKLADAHQELQAVQELGELLRSTCAPPGNGTRA